MIKEFHKYPKIPAFGHDGTEDILDGPIVVQPKVDGSNVSIWIANGEYRLARRNGWLGDDETGMFGPFVKWAKDKFENDERWRSLLDANKFVTNAIQYDDEDIIGDVLVLFGEFTNNQCKLKYETTSPFILFDVASTYQEVRIGLPTFLFAPYTHDKEDSVDVWAQALGVDVIPILATYEAGEVTLEDIKERYLDKPSYLGGPNEEGVVIKSYGRKTRFGRNYFCKLVTAEFAESKTVKARVRQPGLGVGTWAAERFLTDARLAKGIQKLKEDDQWNESARKNIGPLIKTVSQDVWDEGGTEIEEYVMKMVKKEIGQEFGKNVSSRFDDLVREHA